MNANARLALGLLARILSVVDVPVEVPQDAREKPGEQRTGQVPDRLIIDLLIFSLNLNLNQMRRSKSCCDMLLPMAASIFGMVASMRMTSLQLVR